MKNLINRILFLCSGLIFSSGTCSSENVNNELNNLVIIAGHGYSCEVHKVQTADGYILAVHRIPHSKSESFIVRPAKGVVFLQHGVLESSADWTLLGPEKSLPYILANSGYDVWMGNARGNTYSKNHANLSVDSTEFWNFSWHEMGIYDLPAVIDHVLNVTHRDKLFYIGHSMGTTMFFVMASLKPEYANKVETIFALAPVAYLDHMKHSALRFLAKFPDLALYSSFGEKDFSFKCDEIVGYNVLQYYIQAICKEVTSFTVGTKNGQFNETLWPAILKQLPDKTSTKTLMHFKQVLSSGNFRQYDSRTYGDWRNDRNPPASYNLSAIKTPIILHHADNDWYSNEEDVNHLHEELKGSLVRKHLVHFKGFGHMDFIWGKDAPSLIYDKILQDIETKNSIVAIKETSKLKTDWKTFFLVFRLIFNFMFC